MSAAPTSVDWIRLAAVLLAAYKLQPKGGTLSEIQAEIDNFTVDDYAHVARIAARLEVEEQA